MATILRNLSENVGAMDLPAKQYNSHAVYDDHVQYNGTDGRLYNREANYGRTLSDTISIDDVFSHIVKYGRKIIDTTGVSEESTRRYLASRLLSDEESISDFVFYQQRNLNPDVGPTAEIIVIRPLGNAHRDKLIAYSLKEAPTLRGVGKTDNILLSGKIYDSHTIYNKHIPYYNGLATDKGPSMGQISEI